MATVLRSPDGSPSNLRSPPGVTSPRNIYAPPIVSLGTVGKAKTGEYDVPFFTVARYRSPLSPTTYEVPVVPHPPANNGQPTSLISPVTSKAEDQSLISNISPVQLAFGHLEVDNHGIVKDNSDSSSSCCQSSLGSWSSGEQPSGDFRKKRHDDTPVRGFSSVLFSPKPFQSKPALPFKPQKNIFVKNTEKEIISGNITRNKSPEPVKESQNEQSGAQAIKKIENKPYLIRQPVRGNDIKDCRWTIYEDATVTHTGDNLETQISSRPSSSASDQTPRTPKFKSREPSFCLELENEPQDEKEYLAILHLKIAEAHERQLLPLKEDLADWISKLLDLSDITPDNLIVKLDNGVVLCQLAELINKAAQESKDEGKSTVEVPKLPYRIWPRARSGSFFARDNITNFLRFCRRLGVHENLLFETEDLVCRTEVRGVVLCLLEVGRLATLWWGLEAPFLVKLEKELDREDVASRFDNGYGNICIRKDVCLQTDSSNAMHKTDNIQKDRPASAPVQLNARNQNDRKKISSVPPLSARGPKPILPPKPASIKAALCSNTIMRPTNFPTQRTYERGWSGVKTTPVTPAVTPTYSSTTRLPVATTPRSSGRSTPNTTPATPTNSRKYLSSLKKTVSSHSGIPRLTSYPSTSTSSLCSKRHDSFTSPTETELNQMIQIELDNKVKDIAEGIHGVCNCNDASCLKAHVRRLADGKYDIHGRNVLVRLLKGKHVMVRVGGGWDTLEHYLLRHSRSEVKHIKKKIYSPSPNNYCARAHSCPTAKTTNVKTSTTKSNKPSNEDRMPSLIASNVSSSENNQEEEQEIVPALIDIAEIGSCNLISAPVGKNGDFQPPPLAGSGMDSMMVSSCPTLDMVDADDDKNNFA